jgi:hypothetical protein
VTRHKVRHTKHLSPRYKKYLPYTIGFLVKN